MTVAIDHSSFKNTNASYVSATNDLVFNGSGTNTFVTFSIDTCTLTHGDGVDAAPNNVGRCLTAGTVSGSGTFYGKSPTVPSASAG